MSDFKLRTELLLAPSPNKIFHGEKIICMGSCFAENMHQKLTEHGFNSSFSPYGIVFNAWMLAHQLRRLIAGKEYLDHELIFSNEMFSSWDHHGSFSHPDQDVALLQINAHFNDCREKLNHAEYLILTLGTSSIYETKEDRHRVANCHKVPAQHFTKYRITLQELISEFNSSFQELRQFNPGCKILISVSPVRYLQDGLVDNNRSKSCLSMLSEFLEQNFNFVEYFPAFELLIDDLRDYRFVREDMVHPNSMAIHYIWQKFSNVFFTKETQALNEEILSFQKKIKHKPLFPNSESSIRFQNQLKKDIALFKLQHPQVLFPEIGI